jgi:hypothetical protein
LSHYRRAVHKFGPNITDIRKEAKHFIAKDVQFFLSTATTGKNECSVYLLSFIFVMVSENDVSALASEARKGLCEATERLVELSDYCEKNFKEEGGPVPNNSAKTDKR